MLGFGRVGPVDKLGTLENVIKNKGKYAYLVGEAGQWSERKDVRYTHVMDKRGAGLTEFDVFSDMKNQWLKVEGNFGPELGFGHVMGQFHDEPVLLLKACIGNRSLGWDLLPPGSERYQFDGKIHAGYKDNPDSWVEGEPKKEVNWYAGRQYDADINHAKNVLKNLDKYYPRLGLAKDPKQEIENLAAMEALKEEIAEKENFARRARFTQEGLKKFQAELKGLKQKLSAMEIRSQGYQIAGFVFWQGHKDQNPAHASRYEQNLVQLIKSLRADFHAPNAKFVLATIAFGGELTGHALEICKAQLAVDGDAGKYPEFHLNVKAVDARPFWRDKESSPSGQGYHYNHNAETYMEVGQALGWAMVELQKFSPKLGIGGKKR
jgi:alpha-galactosidase